VSDVEIDPAVVEAIRARLDVVVDRIRRAGGEPGPSGVRIVAVTKHHDASVAAAVVAAGLADLGESYARELADKAVAVAATDVATPRWHFIGQLQTNKVRVVAPHVHLFHSIDRSSLIAAVARRVPGAAVLIQVDLAEAPGRGGCAFGELDRLVAEAVDAGLDVRGLMGVAPLAPEVEVARSFGALRRAVDRLGLAECSMGMSQDLEVAVAEGSTMVRIGTALVGARA
jgi:pyridoxal phosphate enzyme (YggS family)